MTSPAASRPPLDADRLSAALADRGVTVELHAACHSTNAIAAERAQGGAAAGLLVVADHQTAGRGRLDRTWETTPGVAVTFSLLLRPEVPVAAWPWLPLLTGRVVAATLRAEGYDAAVKWPNDVLIGDRKVAGILVERVTTARGPAAVVGVGLNVLQTADELPVPTATSLVLERAPDSDGVPDREQVLTVIVSALMAAYQAWLAEHGDVSGLAPAYAAECATVGRQVRVALPGGGTLSGRAVDVDPDGRLVVETDSGPHRIGAGDVVHVRADE